MELLIAAMMLKVKVQIKALRLKLHWYAIAFTKASFPLDARKIMSGRLPPNKQAVCNLIIWSMQGGCVLVY